MAPERQAERSRLALTLRELFPEVCDDPVDPDLHAVAIVVRALNDGSPELQSDVVAYYGFEMVKQIAHSRADRLTNPAYRAWRERLDLPERSAETAFVQGLWMK